VLVGARGDAELPRPILHGRHRIEGVHDEVQDHLLQLDAIAQHGLAGAYQKIQHFGDDFTDNDERAWAACELFLATGDPSYHQKLKEWFDPTDPATRRWGWWRLYQSYGNAIRSYGFAVKSGRRELNQLDPVLLAKCQAEIIKGAEDQIRWAQDNSYGTSFPAETKRVRGLVEGSIVVTLEEIASAIRLLAERIRIVAEGAGASSVAAALKGEAEGTKVVCVISGGNIDPRKLARILNGEIPD